MNDVSKDSFDMVLRSVRGEAPGFLPTTKKGLQP